MSIYVNTPQTPLQIILSSNRKHNCYYFLFHVMLPHLQSLLEKTSLGCDTHMLAVFEATAMQF